MHNLANNWSETWQNIYYWENIEIYTYTSSQPYNKVIETKTKTACKNLAQDMKHEAIITEWY